MAPHLNLNRPLGAAAATAGMADHAAVAAAGAGALPGALVLLLGLFALLQHLQALADEPHLPTHVRHGALHARHLATERCGYGPLLAALRLVALLQVAVAVVQRLRGAAQLRAAAHGAQLAPVRAGAGVRISVTAEDARAATRVWAKQPLEWAGGAVEVLFGEGEGGQTALRCVATLVPRELEKRK